MSYIKSKDGDHHQEIDSNQKVDFGFKKVDINQKTNLVKDIFSTVAPKYDIMNDAMSFGIQRLWKNKMIEALFTELQIKNHQHNLLKILDVASGTGDIALKIAKNLSQENRSYQIEATDINQEMLKIGVAKAIDENLFKNINFTCCSGESLPFQDASFDAVTIAFGIRNFTNINNALAEFNRVLKPNGKLICLEFSKVNDYFLQKIYNFYSFKIIPKMGEIIAKDRASYQYLVESIRKFPPQEEFKKMIDGANFQESRFINLSFGTVAIHIATK